MNTFKASLWQFAVTEVEHLDAKPDSHKDRSMFLECGFSLYSSINFGISAAFYSILFIVMEPESWEPATNLSSIVLDFPYCWRR